MRKCVMLIALCCVSCGPSQRSREAAWADYQAIINRGDAAFQRGVANKARLALARKHFSEATDAYGIVGRDPLMSSPDLFRNLGNAAVLADRWPEAIWAYHSGLKLDPNDRVMREQLAYVRGKVLYPPSGQGRPEPEFWPAWMVRLTWYDLHWLTWVVYSCLWIATAICLIKQSMRWAWVQMGFLALTCLLVYHSSRSREQFLMELDSPLVVVIANTDFYRGNAPSYPKHAELPSLPRGMEARQLHQRGAWRQIRLSTGEVGWIPVASALVVKP